MPSVTFYRERPESLVYHCHEFHILDIEVKINVIKENIRLAFQSTQCSCHEITFGSVDEILQVSTNQEALSSSSSFFMTAGEVADSEVVKINNLKVIVYIFLAKCCSQIIFFITLGPLRS